MTKLKTITFQISYNPPKIIVLHIYKEKGEMTEELNSSVLLVESIHQLRSISMKLSIPLIFMD